MNKDMRCWTCTHKGFEHGHAHEEGLWKRPLTWTWRGTWAMGMLMRGDMGMLLKRSIGNGDSDGRLFCCGGNANSLRSQLLLLNHACQSIVVIKLFICSLSNCHSFDEKRRPVDPFCLLSTVQSPVSRAPLRARLKFNLFSSTNVYLLMKM